MVLFKLLTTAAFIYALYVVGYIRGLRKARELYDAS